MLPEFAYRGRLPAAPGLGAGCTPGDELAKMCLQIIRYGGAGALEVKPASQLLANERVVEWLANRHKLSQKLLDRFGPELLVIATGGLERQGLVADKPLSAQIIKPRAADLESLGSRPPVHIAAIEQLEDIGNQFGIDSMC